MVFVQALSTYLNLHNFETAVIDLGGEDGSDAEVIDEILKKKPAIVGFPVYTVNMKTPYDLIALLRQKGYSGKIVIGAQQASALPEQTLIDFSQVDFLLRYEAEVTLTKLAEYVIKGDGQLNDIENLYYRDGVEIKHTKIHPNINKNLDDLPIPVQIGACWINIMKGATTTGHMPKATTIF